MKLRMRQTGRGLAMGLAAATSIVLVAPLPAAADVSIPEGALVAVGDSVAAGAGLPLVSEPTPQDQACARSSQAYVEYVALAQGMMPHNVACSGATAWAGLIGPQATTAGQVPSQLKQVYQGPHPQRVILTIGANDVKWAPTLQQCLLSVCGTPADDTAFERRLRAAKIGVYGALTALSVLDPERISVTGYYDPFYENFFPETFSPEEITWYRTKLRQLNDMLAEATRHFSRARFVPLSFGGLGLVQGLDQLAPLHPTQKGQMFIANAIVAAG